MFKKILILLAVLVLSFTIYAKKDNIKVYKSEKLTKKADGSYEKDSLVQVEVKGELSKEQKKQMLKDIAELEGDKTPLWIKKQGRYGAFILEGKMVIDSVGISKDLKDESKTYKESTKNAREDLSSIMKLYVKALHDSYNKSIKTDKIPQEEINANIKLILANMNKSRFAGAQVIDRWISKDKAVLTLLEIDLSQVLNIVKVTKGITSPFLKKLDFHSKEAHKALNIKLKSNSSKKK